MIIGLKIKCIIQYYVPMTYPFLLTAHFGNHCYIVSTQFKTIRIYILILREYNEKKNFI